ncbi:MAG: auracyanin [Oligoflexia bacterium]|nr:auracyanin [Oligoflexia bacterium]
MKLLSLFLALLLSLNLGCTRKKGVDTSASEPQTNLVIGVLGETMAFDKTTLVAKAGAEITLTFKNTSTVLKHNWVLTQPGKENEVGMQGIKAGEAKQFIPDNPAVLAYTKLVDVKAEDTITFKAPPAGEYPYICTNAGHHTVMKGILITK